VDRWRQFRSSRAAITAGGLGYIARLLGLAWLSQATGCSGEEMAAGCQAWLWANPFWASFYSNLMSTIAGVALGLPVALYLDRLLGEQRKAAERATERERATARLSMLLTNVLALRRELLIQFANATGKGGPRGVNLRRLDGSVWTALSRDVLVSLAVYGDVGVDLATQLQEFYALLPSVQADIDRIVEHMHVCARSSDPALSMDGPMADALFDIFISNCEHQLKMAQSGA
jgi:hypothetical protein